MVEIVDRGDFCGTLMTRCMLFCFNLRAYTTTSFNNKQGTKQLLIDELLNNDNFIIWMAISVHSGEYDIGMLLLKYIVEVTSITVRGFAFASLCLGLYKQSQKTIVTKQKT